MARLELHGPKGRTERFDLPESGSLLIGSDAVCDVHLKDPEVQPIHARLKVQSGACQVEATPEGKSFLHNGKRTAKCSILPGDELGMGGYRIYLFESQPAPAVAPPLTPKKSAPSPVFEPPAKPVEKTPQPRAQIPEEPMELGWDDVADDSAELAPPLAKTGKSGKAASRGRFRDSADSESKPTEREATAVAGRGVTVFAEDEEETRKLSKTPLVLLLTGTLVVLGLTAFGLWWIIERTRANRAYEAAIANYDSGDFATSGQRFRDFLRLRPNEARSSTARVLEALSRLRETSGGAAPQLAAALTMASKELPALSDEPAWTDRGMEAAEIVAGLARDLATRAQQTGATDTIQSAREAYKLHEELAGEAAVKQRERLKVDNVMAAAEAAVAKGETKSKALAEIDAALGNRQAAVAFRLRDALVNRYPDMGADPAVSKRLDQSNQQVQENVKPLGIKRDAVTSDDPETLGPPITVFARSRSAEAEGTPEPGEINVVSGGALTVGLDSRDGSVLWQRPSGNAAGFEPVSITDDSPPAVLAFDDRSKSLVKLALADGRLIWRQPLGDAPRQPPLVLGNRLILALPTLGQVLWIDLATGRIDDGLDMKWPLAGSITTASNDKTLYIPADESVVFVVSTEDRSCQRSMYLGHSPGSMRVAPAKSGRFVFFAENHEIRTGSLRTLLVDDRGQSPQRLQQETLEGWVWFKPAQQGTLLWASHDRGGFAVYGIGEATQAKPLTLVAKSPALNAPARPTVAIAVGQREALIVDRTAKHYRLEAQTGRMDILRSWPLPEGVPVAAISRIDDYRFVIYLATDKDLGRVAIAIDLRQEKPLWATSWGMPLEPSEGEPGQASLRWTDNRGESVEVKPESSSRPVAVEWVRNPKESEDLASGGDSVGEETKWSWYGTGAGRIGISTKDSKRIRLQAGKDGKESDLTMPLGTRIAPIRIGEILVVAGENGEISLVSIADGSAIGQPFVPDFEKSSPWNWTSMVALEEGSVALADKTGRLVRLVVEKDPPRLRQGARVSLEGSFSGTIVSTGRSVLALKSDGTVLSLAARDLSTQTEWKFPGAGTRIYGVDGIGALIFHPSGSIRVVDSAGQIRRETQAPGLMPAAAPRRIGSETVWLSQNQGSALAVWNDSAESPIRTDLGQWVQGPILAASSGWYVVERPGMLRAIPAELRTASGAKPAGGDTEK